MVSGNQGPWTDRIQALVEAMGWSHHTAAVKLGYRCWAPVERVLRGGRPAVGLLVRLKALEECYAGEVEAWRAGLRFRRGSPGRGWMLDWRDEPAAESTVERRGLGVEGISVGGLGAPAQQALLAGVEFILNDQFQELRVAESVGPGFLQAQAQGARQAGEPELFELDFEVRGAHKC